MYKNLKTGQTSAERPDINPYFVETELFLRFTPEEAEALSKARHRPYYSIVYACVHLKVVLPRVAQLGYRAVLRQHERVFNLTYRS